MTPEKLIHAIVLSYDYNRSDAHLLRLIKNVLARAQDTGVPVIPYDSGEFKEVREDADIFYGILVNCYGDYGVSPRYGWIESENKKVVIQALKDKFESELNDTKALIEMMPERYSAEELKELKALITEMDVGSDGMYVKCDITCSKGDYKSE